ncbi:hypothetical protein CHR53_26805 [Neobacillus mesonae]|uniref:Uncharacterized protein n=1 Tax=Neobacillus mesonae TaxID=1193713 RepID=A0A3T0I5C9_9BACI|nr:hypothetical protein CHR53_26805 [Neobacillus mesonae]
MQNVLHRRDGDQTKQVSHGKCPSSLGRRTKFQGSMPKLSLNYRMTCSLLRENGPSLKKARFH